MRLLVVEDETTIASDISDAFQAIGYVVECVADGESAWFKGSTEDYDAIVLDLNLPRLDGLSVLGKLRDEGVNTPILILTARNAWLQRVEGIDAGADDYLTKPFHMEELIARIGALIRRAGGHATPILKVGDIDIDTRRLRALVRGKPIDLTQLEYRLLRFLAHNRGRVVSQFEISEHVYQQDREPDNNAIEALIARLRRKVGPDVIATRRGHGYVVEA
jgi:two-component system, OmpR family, response regulator